MGSGLWGQGYGVGPCGAAPRTFEAEGAELRAEVGHDALRVAVAEPLQPPPEILRDGAQSRNERIRRAGAQQQPGQQRALPLPNPLLKPLRK